MSEVELLLLLQCMVCACLDRKRRFTARLCQVLSPVDLVVGVPPGGTLAGERILLSLANGICQRPDLMIYSGSLAAFLSGLPMAPDGISLG